MVLSKSRIAEFSGHFIFEFLRDSLVRYLILPHFLGVGKKICANCLLPPDITFMFFGRNVLDIL